MDRVDLGTSWLKALLDEEIPADLVAPFLTKCAKNNEASWVSFTNSCLENPRYRGVACALILTLPNAPTELFENTLHALNGYEGMIRVLCLRKQVPEPVLKRLLQHSDSSIRSAVAYGEWFADPKESVRNAIYELWRSVLLADVDDAYFIKRVLLKDPVLAAEWLENFILHETEWNLFHFKKTVQVAVDALTIEVRKRLLLQIPSRHFDTDNMLGYLIGDDLSLYQALLSSDRLERFHLSPLARTSESSWTREGQHELNDTWVEMAKLALDAGYSSEEISRSVHSIMISWSGDESDMWDGWVKKFDKLCSEDDERIQKVGKIGKDRTEALKQDALKQEKLEAVYGR